MIIQQDAKLKGIIMMVTNIHIRADEDFKKLVRKASAEADETMSDFIKEAVLLRIEAMEDAQIADKVIDLIEQGEAEILPFDQAVKQWINDD